MWEDCERPKKICCLGWQRSLKISNFSFYLLLKGPCGGYANGSGPRLKLNSMPEGEIVTNGDEIKLNSNFAKRQPSPAVRRLWNDCSGIRCFASSAIGDLILRTLPLPVPFLFRLLTISRRPLPDFTNLIDCFSSFLLRTHFSSRTQRHSREAKTLTINLSPQNKARTCLCISSGTNVRMLRKTSVRVSYAAGTSERKGNEDWSHIPNNSFSKFSSELRNRRPCGWQRENNGNVF